MGREDVARFVVADRIIGGAVDRGAVIGGWSVIVRVAMDDRALDAAHPVLVRGEVERRSQGGHQRQ